MSDHRRHAAAPPADLGVELVTERFVPDPFAKIAGRWATLADLRGELVWDPGLNMAILPDDSDPQAPDQFRLFAAHATASDQEVLEPRLTFDQIPIEQRARNKSVYGTGLYVANRPEAALTVEAQRTGKSIVAFLSDPIERTQIVDERRSRVASELAHLVGMVGTEVIMPRLIGHEKTARKYAERANKKWQEQGARLVLLNEAPRRRAEKMPHEKQWSYGEVPPQYALLRVPMHRIGTFKYPTEEAHHNTPRAMYGRLFWEAAIRNAHDMARIGAPHEFTSRG
ncbi:MAG TPA: hypothetical protein VLA92_04845 [Candidatus Saccharimonadales bacterium]|nr:hypothetical protein [Candidatus Saccharimonadales bacterium]